jgi:hypothetical protein
MKKRTGSIQYLLSADRRLRRLSLKRMPTRMRAASHPLYASRSQKARRPKKAASSPFGPRASLLAAVICILGAGELIGARQPARQVDPSTAVLQAGVNLQSSKPTVTREAESKKIPSAATVLPTGVLAKIAVPPAAAADKTEIPKTSATGKAGPDAIAVTTPSSEPAHKSHVDIARPAAKDLPAAAATVAVASAAKPEVEHSASATITGCLEFSDQRFRLKDTSGADAPKSRSWKSGFLAKRSSPIDLVDVSNTLKLSTHVGQRVSATGTLVNREMRASSLQSVSSSCR